MTMDTFSLIIDSLRKNDPVAARKQLNMLMRSGDLPQNDWLTVYGVLLLITKAIDGRGDFMQADTKKAWWTYHTEQALEKLLAHLGMNEIIQFPVEDSLCVEQAA